MPLLPLDGPSLQDTKSVDTITVVEAKVGLTALEERKVLTIQPVDGKIYVYFGNGTTVPNAATVSSDGFIVFKNAKESYEVSEEQPIYLLSSSGTVNVKVAERA